MRAPDPAQLANLALACLRREFPNKPEHVMNDAADVLRPRVLHPAFYGCLDWHSAVHGHWMLARIARTTPLPEIHALFDEHLTMANLAIEAAYFAAPNRRSFERMYGWAWLLQLARELAGSRWAAAVQVLADVIVARLHAFLPAQRYPIRTGVHPNTAFGLGFAHDYAVALDDRPLRALVEERALTYFGTDADVPARFEPGGEDFLSPVLVEADLMRRVLAPAAFAAWFHRLLPRGLETLATPAVVGDRSDPKLAHLDGLNLSRAWCLRAIATALAHDPRHGELVAAAEAHAREGLAHVMTGDYAGEHWLASFAVYLGG